MRPAEDYLAWVRNAAEAKWAARKISELPWWAHAASDNELEDLRRHPTARSFDRRTLAEDRVQLKFADFTAGLETVAGLSHEDLPSRSRDSALVRQRIELGTLAIGRYRLRVCDVAVLAGKHPNSIAELLNTSLRLERGDP